MGDRQETMGRLLEGGCLLLWSATRVVRHSGAPRVVEANNFVSTHLLRARRTVA